MKQPPPSELELWVQAASDATQLEFRKAIHTILTAISLQTELRGNMVMKGGILMALRFGSLRFTRDIDFSTQKNQPEITPDGVQQCFESSLPLAVEMLNYGIECRIQRFKIQPSILPKPTFPSIEITIGYAEKGSAKHAHLLRKQSPSVITIDYSLNEVISSVDTYNLDFTQSLRIYSLVDVIAEKFRALLQQPSRKRARRQDIYDLAFLSEQPLSQQDKQHILESLLLKSNARSIFPTALSMRDPEVKRWAQLEYNSLKDDLPTDLPPFETSFAQVTALYESLPWPQ